MKLYGSRKVCYCWEIFLYSNHQNYLSKVLNQSLRKRIEIIS
uniref:Bm1288 n=1 Tax=Brugia malayi TaxID=6279 RepID=A0A1I9G207_BRUMA|nr:Bm1288 [Brugia malayi]